MKKNSGIVLASLVITIIIMLIIATITVYSTLESYNRMKYESFRVEMEEIQRKTDEICDDYKIYLKYRSTTDADTNYQSYFLNKYGNSPKKLSSFSNTEDVAVILENYFYMNDEDGKKGLHYHDGYVFYFEKQDIETYLDIKGMDDAILIDFATRKAYSVNGVKNPDFDYKKPIVSSNLKRFYTPSDWNESLIVEESDEKKSSLTLDLQYPTLWYNVEYKKVGSTPMFDTKLKLINRPNLGTIYPITKVYYSTNKNNWFEITNIKIEGDTVTFVMYDEGNYYFKFEDSSGAEKAYINESVAFHKP